MLRVILIVAIVGLAVLWLSLQRSELVLAPVTNSRNIV